MNNTLKIALGALAGAGVGYFVGEVVIEVIALREIEALAHLPGQANEDWDPIPEQTVKKETKKMSKKQEEKKDYTKFYEEKPELKNLVAKYNLGVVEPEDEDENASEPEYRTVNVFDEVREDSMELGDVEDETITIISHTEFTEADGIAKVELLYFDDDVVTDVHSTPIDKPEQILGDDALVCFGELSDDPDVVYVRNDDKDALYRVVRVNKNFSEPVLRRAQKARAKVEEDTDGEPTS